MQSQNHSPFVAGCGLPSVGIVETKSLLTPPRNPEIREPPVDDVNKPQPSLQVPALLAPMAIQIRRNALFNIAGIRTSRQPGRPRLADVAVRSRALER